MRYRLSCDGQLLLCHDDAHTIQAAASYHACTADYLDWQYDPETPTVTTAEYRGRVYRVEIVPFEERHAARGV